MTTQEKINILKSYSLFSDLSSQELEHLASSAKEKVFPKNSFLIHQDQPANAVYLIYKGLVQIYMESVDGKVIPIRVKGPLYMVGELNLFDNEATTHVEALQDTNTLAIDKQVLLGLLKKSSSLSIKLLQEITEKLRAANKNAQEYASVELKDRTWHILQSLSSHFPNKEITLSQEELSFIVGASRARITEVLDKLVKENVISLSHKKIHIL